jgi:voltage-gated potassium channel
MQIGCNLNFHSHVLIWSVVGGWLRAAFRPWNLYVGQALTSSSASVTANREETHMIMPRQPARARPVLFLALLLSIPAFYLVLSGSTAYLRGVGGWLYGIVAIMIAIDVVVHARTSGRLPSLWNESALNMMIVLGAIASMWPSAQPWSPSEWLLRLGLCSVVFIRLSMLLAKWVAPHNLMQILAVAVAVMAIAGAGFYWLEPTVRNYADGLWLAFVTVATVGYGDLFPTSAGARVFAVFIVLLGYALFSVVTATISAFFVGEDEQRFERELHADIRSLREEIAALRGELRESIVPEKDAPDKAAKD